MTSRSKKSHLAAVGLALLGISGALGAQQPEAAVSAGCSNKTLRGPYAFALAGSVLDGGQPVPFAISGITSFFGKNGTTIVGQLTTADGSPAIAIDLEGTYVVSEACTGTARYAVKDPTLFGLTELRFDGVLVKNGEEIRYSVTTPRIVLAGASVKQHVKGQP